MFYIFKMIWIISLCIMIKVISGIKVVDEIDENGNKLQLVLVLHRHGLRAPEETWNSDPYKNQDLYWKVGWAELLPEGKQELYALGKTLRERYRNFISHYSIKAVRVRSSDYDRCLMSVASLLAGWFPPRHDQVWTNEIMWQPIPIHNTPIMTDWVLARGDPCPKYELELQKALSYYKGNETEADKILYAYLSKHMNETLDDPVKLSRYYMTMIIEDTVGYTLPEWTKPIYPEILRQKALGVGLAIISNEYLRKMLGGPMVQELMHKFNQKIEGENQHRKLLVYSAHDYTVSGMWVALGLPPDEIFPAFFGSALVFELYKARDSTYYVKMFRYNDTTVTEPFEITLPYCSKPCSLESLFNNTNYVRSADPIEDCIIP